MNTQTTPKRMHCAGRCKVGGIFDFDGFSWTCRCCGWQKKPTAAEWSKVRDLPINRRAEAVA